MTASPPTLKLGYRNPGHLLFTYCAYLSRGELWVRSPEPYDEGTELRLEFAVPGHRWTERLAATVSQRRTHASLHSPPGMKLKVAPSEALEELVDRLVPLSSPCRVQLVGANAFSTRHVASITQTVMDCRIEHRELREDVLPRCAGSDLVVVDLDVNEDVAISLISALADQPNAPTLVVLSSDLRSEAAHQAARMAHIARLPLEAREFRRALLCALSQTCWLGQHRVANIMDKVPVLPDAPEQKAPPKQPIRLRAASPSASIPPIVEREPSQDWEADTSWNDPHAKVATSSSQDIYDAPASSPVPSPAAMNPTERHMLALGTDLELSAQWDEWLPPPPSESLSRGRLATQSMHSADVASAISRVPHEPSLETSVEDLGLEPVEPAQPALHPAGCDDPDPQSEAAVRRSA